jgi:acyl-CoA synthetase (AMP-forming)/AMP-acid ligase II
MRFAVKKHGDKVAIIDGNKCITLDELNQSVNKLCHGLLSLGMQKGDKIAVLLHNRKEYIEIRLASYKYGFIFCALIDDFTQNQRLETLNEIMCRILFYDDRLTDNELEEIKLNTNIEFYIPVTDQPEVPNYQQLLSKNAKEPQIKIKSYEISAIGFTSGTTGKSKGIVWSHKAWLYSFYHFLLNSDSTNHNMVFLHVVPFSTAGSLPILPAIVSGAKNILIPTFDVVKVAQTIDREKVTNLLLPPSFLIELWDYYMAHRDVYHFKSVKSFIVGSAPLPGNKWTDMIDAFGPIVQQSYGMAEVLAPIASLRIKNPDVEKKKLISVGKVVKQVKLKLIDIDSNNRGIICLRSNTCGVGYWKMEDLTRHHFQNGWFITDDIVAIDQNSNLYIIDRVANIIKTDLEKIFPREIEEIIHYFPGVKEAVVIKKEENIIAFISVRRNFKLDLFQLKQFCNEVLSTNKIPEAFILIDHMPHSTSGKILKDQLNKYEFDPLSQIEIDTQLINK